MSTFVRGIAALLSNRQLSSSFQDRTQRLALLVAVSLWIPWTLACGASAQAAPSGTNGSNGHTTLQITSQLPTGAVAKPYVAAISIQGGRSPFQFQVSQGSLPAGLSLQSSLGVVYGRPQVAGQFNFTVQVTDSAQNSGTAQYRLVIGPAQGGGGPITVAVSPSTINLSSASAQKFSAVLQGTSNTAVNWTASAGTIAADGTFAAPTVNTQTTVTVTATSVADPTKQGSAAVTVEPAASSQPLAIQTSSLPGAESGQPYQENLAASGGKPPYTWSATTSLPSGFSLGKSGLLSGTTAAAGSYPLTVQVADAASHSVQQSLTLTVSNTSSGNFDGPAELPRVYVNTAMSDTPAPGNIISVNAGGSLQAAVRAANCGDTIELQAGAEFAGIVVLPGKPCDDQHWIIIRTSAPDSALPPEGQRLTPCYAGVASLPNRPAYPCSNPQNVLARITMNQAGVSGPVVLQNGASHYRFIGLEITRPANLGPIIALITPAQDAVVDHLIVDRSWVHGSAQDDTRRGVEMFGMNNVAVIDSYFNDFHCTAHTGACSDSQTVGSGGGHTPNGPYKIVDNFLEASGENILFSGMGAEYPPADIEIRKNHFFKPMQWMPGSAGFVGGNHNNPFVVKNHIEFKNGMRALIEANIFENNWGGFSQAGYSILLTARNNYDAMRRRIDCANCQVTDITVRFNRISHVGNGFLIANLLVKNQIAAAGGRFSIHDDVLEDLDAQKYGGGGTLATIGNGWPTNVLNSINIRHVTAFPDPNHNLLVVGNSQNNQQMWGFTFSDNIVIATRYPVWSVGNYTNDCSASNIPVQTVNTCFRDNHFTNNVIIAAPPAFQASKWPTGSFFPADIPSVGFVGYKSGGGGDYTLSSSSAYHDKASDGTDPGANISELNQALTGVE